MRVVFKLYSPNKYNVDTEIIQESDIAMRISLRAGNNL